MMKLVILALAFGAASAVCPNSCSGHGTCAENDVCVCYQNWGMGDEASGDCSQMYCPFEYAFVDAPDMDGKVHKYLECSGKGLCDRSTGDCECFEGYTGKGCQRTSCPNDCSGHGTCEYIEELTFGSTPGEYVSAKTTSEISATEAVTFSVIDEAWDAHKSMACLCDAGYIDVDCSRRMCPKGNDVFDTRLDLTDSVVYQVQTITLSGAGTDGAGTGAAYADIQGDSFALTFVSTLNETYTTIPIVLPALAADLETAVQSALMGLPNGVIDQVTVSATTGASTTLLVTFDGATVEGKQNLLIVEADACADGCTPKITGLDLESVSVSALVTESTISDYNNYECGRRGKCDYDSGICECFEGYTGVACGTQTALV